MAQIIKIHTTWLWYGLGRKSPSSHHERPGLIPGQSIWDLWRTGTGVSPNTLVFLHQYHFTNVAYSFTYCQY